MVKFSIIYIEIMDKYANIGVWKGAIVPILLNHGL